MTVKLRIPKMLHDEMLVDLRRPHAFAFERVGFMYCKQSSLRNGRLLLAYKYRPIEDEQRHHQRRDEEADHYRLS